MAQARALPIDAREDHVFTLDVPLTKAYTSIIKGQKDASASPWKSHNAADMHPLSIAKIAQSYHAEPESSFQDGIESIHDKPAWKAKEFDQETSRSDDILLDQRELLTQQGQNLEHISNTIGHIRSTAYQIMTELDDHVIVLKETETHMDHIDGIFQRTYKNLQAFVQVSRRGSGGRWIIVLMVLLIITIVILIVV